MTKARYREELQENLDRLYFLLNAVNHVFMPDDPFGLYIMAEIHDMIEDLEAERDSD